VSPVTHFLAGWLLAEMPSVAKPAVFTRRDKALVVAAAVAPDLDGLGVIPELLTRSWSHPLLWFSDYHHALHTLTFALVCALAAFLLAGPLDRVARGAESPGRIVRNRPWMTALLVFLSFHLHSLCDLVGARGPDGYQWPIPYLKPYSDAMQLTWSGQWALNGWQNFVITGMLLLATFWIALRKGSSPVELVSIPASRALIETLRNRFPSRRHQVRHDD
jgi:inner membrane protein